MHGIILRDKARSFIQLEIPEDGAVLPPPIVVRRIGILRPRLSPGKVVAVSRNFLGSQVKAPPLHGKADIDGIRGHVRFRRGIPDGDLAGRSQAPVDRGYRNRGPSKGNPGDSSILGNGSNGFIAAGPDDVQVPRVFGVHGGSKGEHLARRHIRRRPVQGYPGDGHPGAYGTDRKAISTFNTVHAGVTGSNGRRVAFDNIRIVQRGGPVTSIIAVRSIIRFQPITCHREEKLVIRGKMHDFPALAVTDRLPLPGIVITALRSEQCFHFRTRRHPPGSAKVHAGRIVFWFKFRLVIRKAVFSLRGIRIVFREGAFRTVTPFVYLPVIFPFRLRLAPGIITTEFLRFGGAKVEISEKYLVRAAVLRSDENAHIYGVRLDVFDRGRFLDQFVKIHDRETRNHPADNGDVPVRILRNDPFFAAIQVADFQRQPVFKKEPGQREIDMQHAVSRNGIGLIGLAKQFRLRSGVVQDKDRGALTQINRTVSGQGFGIVPPQPQIFDGMFALNGKMNQSHRLFEREYIRTHRGNHR